MIGSMDNPLKCRIFPVVLLPMGYPDETSIPHPNHNRRLNIAETVFF